MVGDRIEKIVTITKDRDVSDKYPNYGWSFDFEDEDGTQFEWNTITSPIDTIQRNQKWLVRMTIENERECLGLHYWRVKNVRFIKQVF